MTIFINDRYLRFSVSSGNLEVTCPLRKSRFAGSTSTGVDRFPECKDSYTRSKRPRRTSKSSPTQLSNATRRHPNKQEDEKDRQGGNRKTEGKSSHYSGISCLKCPFLNLAKADQRALEPLHDTDSPGRLASYQL
ncbi:hypothetical protein TNCV_2555951 [Trichonephila clavipes]|nr:hypothetical protein TNCV_2555951 [Trichonephila clavipes]